MMVYSTETGQGGKFFGPEFLGMPEVRQTIVCEYCFICNRATDHVGEHDEIAGVVYDVTETQRGPITYVDVYVKVKE